MKIIKLTFENINSYEGEVTIDFTDPGIRKGNNQFVVCGPMGSGKSTILDAITLALYGSTDRLGRLTTSSADSSNELINKHSGYCRAEVMYSCAKGVFASAFELHKARDKADGKVQTPQCALYEMAGGERVRNMLDSTSTDALKKATEEIIGLSYEQFIRCILIPQGEFDQFLNSNEREKAGILAKLSHTEHYKEAARILNEKASSLNQEYSGLKKERDAITVMSEEDREECEKKKAGHQKKAEELKGKIDELIKKINWLEQLGKAESDFYEAKKSLEDVQAESEGYRLKTEELNNAGKAEDCAAEYRSLQECIKDIKDIQEKKANAQTLLARYASEKEAAGKEAKRCEVDYSKKKEEKEKQKGIWTRVRNLDTQISVAKSNRDARKTSRDDLKRNYDKRKADYTTSEAFINENANKIRELSDYLEKNKADSALESLLAAYAVKIKTWKEANARLIRIEWELKKHNEEKEQRKNLISDLEKEKERIEKELHDLVSSKYLLVAGILRKDLKSGTACPVCGKKYISDDGKELKDHIHSQTDISDEEEKVAGDISDLNKSLEEKNQAIIEENSKLQSVDIKIETATENAARERSSIEDLKAEFNSMFQPWGILVDDQTSEGELGGIEEELRSRKDQYISNKNDLDKINSECEKARARMNSIDLDHLMEECNAAEQNYETADQEYQKLDRERQELFGKKSVDEEEEALDKEIREKEEQKVAADKAFQDKKNKHSNTATEINGFENSIAELNGKQADLNRGFREKLEKNHFGSKEEFLNCLRSKQIISDLNNAVKEYEKKKTASEATYNKTKEELDKLRSNVLTTESFENLNEQKEKLESGKTVCDQEIGGLVEKLDQDDRNKKAWNEADSKLQKLGTEAEIYSRINEMLGKKDGSDFEVFVQGIAMRSLLDKANVYLESIIPKYRLVQRSDNSIDFLVHETMGDLTVIKREVRNFSGGEKFIISLSLALAMAEFAGQNGDVECIFLDEGFGTLSGAPLLDAINALKRLSSTGKMLGIITHIEAVIQAFNKIEARKTGEKSRLYGPGVTYTDRKVKAK